MATLGRSIIPARDRPWVSPHMPSRTAPTRNASHDPAPRLLYDRKAASTALSLSVRSIDYLIARKQLAFRKVGKKVLIPHGELVRFASKNHFGPVNPENEQIDD